MKKNRLLKGMSSKLKDPKSFKLIEKKLAKILKSNHKHATIKSYATCAWCNEKRQEREKAIEGYGFKSFAQYMEWKKIHGLMSQVRDLQNVQAKQKA